MNKINIYNDTHKNVAGQLFSLLKFFDKGNFLRRIEKIQSPHLGKIQKIFASENRFFPEKEMEFYVQIVDTILELLTNKRNFDKQEYYEIINYDKDKYFAAFKQKTLKLAGNDLRLEIISCPKCKNIVSACVDGKQYAEYLRNREQYLSEGFIVELSQKADIQLQTCKCK